MFKCRLQVTCYCSDGVLFFTKMLDLLFVPFEGLYIFDTATEVEVAWVQWNCVDRLFVVGCKNEGERGEVDLTPKAEDIEVYRSDGWQLLESREN